MNIQAKSPPGSPPDTIPVDATQSTKNETVKVPIAVHKWVKSMHNSAWLGRSSRHLATHIRYEELDDLLAQDHGHQEARYTPSIYDTNELLAWSSDDLEKAVTKLTCKNRVKRVQMSSKSWDRIHATKCIAHVSNVQNHFLSTIFGSKLTKRSLSNVPQDAASCRFQFSE